MLEISTLEEIKTELKSRLNADAKVLEEMRKEVRPLKSAVRRIQPRSTNAVSLVGTDGGNNYLRFDPFQVQLIRVVDSSSQEYCLEVVTNSTSIDELTERHFSGGNSVTPLGKMMDYLEVKHLSELSPVFKTENERQYSGWIEVYRTMTEWAVLFQLVRETSYGSDTLFVFDGLLREKMFTKNLFERYREGLEEGIRQQFSRNRRRYYICGIAKHSSVIQAYRIAMALEGVMRNTFSCYLEVPEEIEQRVYKWDEWVRLPRFNAGKLFLVKFGPGPYDPVWAVDLLVSQKGEAQTIFGYLLNDAKDGFPVPFYPYCLQKAHENSALVDFDMDILQKQICDVLRETLGDKAPIIDELALQESDPSSRRYN